jgi:hypothetical protein
MDNLTVELVKTAQDRNYVKFEEVAKELLKSKLQETESYKETMKKLQEACGKKVVEDEDNDPDSKDAKQNSDDEDGDGKKDSEEKHGDLKKDFTGKHKDADKED